MRNINKKKHAAHQVTVVTNLFESMCARDLFRLLLRRNQQNVTSLPPATPIADTKSKSRGQYSTSWLSTPSKYCLENLMEAVTSRPGDKHHSSVTNSTAIKKPLYKHVTTTSGPSRFGLNTRRVDFGL